MDYTPMRLDQASLSYVICEVLNVKPESPAFFEVLRHTVAYIVSRTNIKTYHRQLSSCVDFSTLEITPAFFRLKLLENAYVLKNIHYFSANVSLARNLGKTELSAMAKRFGIKACDSRYIAECVNTELRKQVREFVRSKGLTKRSYSVEAYNGLTVELADLLVQLDKFTRYTVRNKLRFIFKYHNMAASDFESEVMCHVVRAYYHSNPSVRTPAHQLNYLKSTVTSRVNNIIDSYTSQKRRRLVNVGTDNKEGAKFALITTSEAQLPLDADGLTQSLENIAEGTLWDSPTDSQEFNITLERLIARTKGTKRGVIIRVFAGHDVDMFTKFLRKKRILRSDMKTCQDIFNTRPMEEVCDLLTECLGISKNAVYKAIKEYSHDLGL